MKDEKGHTDKKRRKRKATTVNLGKKGKFKVHKGALHRALGVSEGEKIPASKMAQARRSKNPHVRNMARSAKGLEAMGHGHKKKSRDKSVRSFE